MNAEDEVDPALLSLAARIAEGTGVDPDEEPQLDGQDTDRDVLKALLDIAVIEAAHRSAERSFDRMQFGPLDDAAPVGAADHSGEDWRRRVWRSLPGARRQAAD